MSKMWEKLNMSSWEDILNRHRPRATSYYNPLNREWVEPVNITRHNNVIPGLLKLDDKD